jgi:uncharacterized membrane protein
MSSGCWRDPDPLIFTRSGGARRSPVRLRRSADASRDVVRQAVSVMSARLLSSIAIASLVALMIVSLAFVVASAIGAVGTPPGLVLAIVKVGVLAFVLKRVWDANVYSMQWSSMLILLFIAEGTVRAMSDPQPSAALGCVETALATIYFATVLAILRPLKQQAKKKPAAPR